jgi:hypothetical protein
MPKEFLRTRRAEVVRELERLRNRLPRLEGSAETWIGGGPHGSMRAHHARNPDGRSRNCTVGLRACRVRRRRAGSLAASWSAGCLGRTFTAVPRERLILSGGEERKRQRVESAGPIQQHRKRDEFAADP